MVGIEEELKVLKSKYQIHVGLIPSELEGCQQLLCNCTHWGVHGSVERTVCAYRSLLARVHDERYLTLVKEDLRGTSLFFGQPADLDDVNRVKGRFFPCMFSNPSHLIGWKLHKNGNVDRWIRVIK